MSDTLISAAILVIPLIGIAWSWKKRIRDPRSFRERLSLVALVLLTLNLLWAAACLFVPYFGAVRGQGSAAWARAASFVAVGYYTCIAALLAALVSKSSTTHSVRSHVGQRFVLVLLGSAAVFFWLGTAMGISDIYAVEQAREAAAQRSQLMTNGANEKAAPSERPSTKH